MKELLSIFLVGLTQKELYIVLLLMHLRKMEQYGEVPGSNLRNILNVTKDALFLELEKLVQKNILRFSSNKIANTVYIGAGEKGYYVLNPFIAEWSAVSESYFYRVCKLLGYTYNKDSWQSILRDVDFREELIKDTVRAGEEKITPFEVFDLFCGKYKKVFGKEYMPVNQASDLQRLKKLIFDAQYDNYSVQQIKDFLEWCFRAKSKEFKGDFIIGFLPLCFQDYRKVVTVQKVKPGYYVDDDGNLRTKNENK